MIFKGIRNGSCFQVLDSKIHTVIPMCSRHGARVTFRGGRPPIGFKTTADVCHSPSSPLEIRS